MSKNEKSTSKPLSTLHDLAEKLTDASVLAIGDIMLDRFVYGDVHRISPESPVPVLSVREEVEMPGGVGNVLANLTGLGARAYVVALIGKDSAGETLRRLVAEKGADVSGLLLDETRPTTLKSRFLASNQQLLRADHERTTPVLAAQEAALLAKAEAALPHVGAVVLSDYGKGVLTPTLIAAIIERAGRRKIPVLVDPKGADYRLYKGASVVTPNRKELSLATADMPTGTDSEVVKAAQTVMDQAQIGAVVATRSQDGMTIVARAQDGKNFAEPVHLRTEAREVFDVSGAGDTVIATLAAALAVGADITAAAGVANTAAGIVVAKVGTAPVRRAELLTALDRKDSGLRPRQDGTMVVDVVREAEICSADDAADIIGRWKARGLRVGFTNGCFDILHQGHVTYLNRARDYCDRLVVALNADESVRRLKGPERPVNNEDARAAIIGALGAVDMVILFGQDPLDTDKPLRLIERLRPDIYFKGGDYKLEQLEEVPIVRGYGGEVALMPLSEGHSTTNTIQKLRAGK